MNCNTIALLHCTFRSARYIAIVISAVGLSATTTSAASQLEDPCAKAKRYFGEAENFHSHERYTDAILKLKEAKGLCRKPLFDFNIGEAYRLAGDNRQAWEYYQRYVGAVPTGKASKQARKLIKSLAQELMKEAQEHAGRAQAAVNAQAFDQALTEYNAAEAAWHDPKILIEIAKVLAQKGDRLGAIDSYRRYLTEVPDGSRSNEVQASIAKLEQEILEERAKKEAARKEEERLRQEEVAGKEKEKEREEVARKEEEGTRQEEAARKEERLTQEEAAQKKGERARQEEARRQAKAATTPAGKYLTFSFIVLSCKYDSET